MLRDEIEKKINQKRIQNKINNNQKNEEQIKKKKKDIFQILQANMISEERRGERKHREGKKSPLKINHHASTDTSQTIGKISMTRLSKIFF
jgi:hypothetical protein